MLNTKPLCCHKALLSSGSSQEGPHRVFPRGEGTPLVAHMGGLVVVLNQSNSLILMASLCRTPPVVGLPKRLILICSSAKENLWRLPSLVQKATDMHTLFRVRRSLRSEQEQR